MTTHFHNSNHSQYFKGKRYNTISFYVINFYKLYFIAEVSKLEDGTGKKEGWTGKKRKRRQL